MGRTPTQGRLLRQGIGKFATIERKLVSGVASMAEEQSIFYQLLTQKTLPADLVVVYTDRHSFHGGTTFELGAGKITYQFHDKARREVTAVTKDLSEGRLARVVALLVALEAWKQQEEARRYVLPDESFAYLTIKSANHEARIWESYHNLLKNNRLILIARRIEDVFAEDAS
jgi:hypothetical protein